MSAAEFDRSFHAYCVGLPKAGTHSLAGLLEPKYRSYHEPKRDELMAHFLQWVLGHIDDEDLRGYVRSRDETLDLEMDSSVYNFFLLPFLVDEFPRAKFILLVRDCLTWVDSAMRHIRAGITAGRELRFWASWLHRSRYTHAPQEAHLEDLGIFPVRCYLEGWSRFLDRVTTLVPASRLLVMRTDEINRELPRLASFLGVPPSTLNPGNAHLNRAPAEDSPLDSLDPDFVDAVVEECCVEPMARFFPGAEPRSFWDESPSVGLRAAAAG